MTADEIKKEMRQLIMLVSSIRSQDMDHFESHTKFVGELIEYVRKIETSMNENWEKINTSLISLNRTVEESLNSLLSGVNPESLKETSKALKEIQNSMGKSIQAMNLENIMRELQGVSGSGVTMTVATPTTKTASKSAKASPIPISASMSTSYTTPATAAAGKMESSGGEDDDGLSADERKQITSVYGYVPDHLKKQSKKKKETKEPHLLKPSDFFGS